MFRTKKKKASASVARKRKDLDDEEESEQNVDGAIGGEPMEVDGGGDASRGEAVPPTIAAAHDDDADDDALLERMRIRAQKSKAKANAMSFSSKSMSSKKSGAGERNGRSTQPMDAATGVLSFDDETAAEVGKKTGHRMLRIRPDLSAAHADSLADSEGSTGAARMYSGDMLASLLREQNVLLRQLPPKVDGDQTSMDVEMSGADDLDEEVKGESAEDADDMEEFIPLDAKLLRARKNKKRVSFGMHDEIHLPKTAEVEDPMERQSEEDEEDDQSRRWEEELMRRGGQHVQPKAVPSRNLSDDKLVYPTRKKVAYATLAEVTRSLQRKLESGATERDRTSRELSRLDAETSLIVKQLGLQHEELLVNSEQFEYFQVVEDFVRGLSFCLREKLPQIEAEEKRFMARRVSESHRMKDMRKLDIANEIQLCLAENKILDSQFFGLEPQGFDSNGSIGDDWLGNKDSQLARLTRLQVGHVGTLQHQRAESSALHIFDDTVEDMNSLGHVYGRFQEWKAKFPEVYKNAYCDLALAKLYAPYVRAELIDWDPLSISTRAPGSSEAKRLSGMDWFNILRQHGSGQSNELEEPVISLVRDVVVGRVLEDVQNRYSPFSATHTQSVILLHEDVAKFHALPHCQHGVDEVIGCMLDRLLEGVKDMPLLALNDDEMTLERARVLGRYLVSEFCGLLENALALFVALPNGSLHQRAFSCVMQMLHQLLAYLTQCKRLNKTALIAQATQTVKQLSVSSFMQSILVRSAREQREFQHLVELFKPFLKP